jgi:hypothetical protein
VCACNNPSPKTGSHSAVEKVKAAADTIIYPSDSDTIWINIVDGKGTVRIHKKEQQNINLKFSSQDYTQMYGVLSFRDSTANIRFSQITMPNGSMDGPFGKDITYDLKEKGNYRLSVHESLMAGDPWAGDFTVTINLSK